MSKWYILHVTSGAENKTKRNISDQIARSGMQKYFDDFFIPVVLVPEVKKGKRVDVEKKLMPGYLLIKMHMCDESWHLVKNVIKNQNFLGSKSSPQALTEAEVQQIFKQVELANIKAQESGVYAVGDKVNIVDGPFDSFTGIVEEVEFKTQKIKVSVSIFGKPTPIELNFNQIKKSE